MMTTEPKIIPWWERDEELQLIAAKYDQRGVCCCRCEGVEESVYYICATCPPKSLTHMRAIVKHAMKIAEERGKREALEAIQEKIDEVWKKL